MNIIERAKQFLQSLHEAASRTAWDWKKCPKCGSMNTNCWGTYTRKPWFLDGRREVKVQRHKCKDCGPTYSETTPLLKRGSWYAREVHRSAIDLIGCIWEHRYDVRQWCCAHGWGVRNAICSGNPWRRHRRSQHAVICQRARCIAGWIRQESKRRRVWRDSWWVLPTPPVPVLMAFGPNCEEEANGWC